MRKVTIEVPDNMTDFKLQEILERALSNDWIAAWWHISDVKECFGGPLSDEDAREILQDVICDHDASVGVNWDVINYYVGEWRKEQEES